MAPDSNRFGTISNGHFSHQCEHAPRELSSIVALCCGYAVSRKTLAKPYVCLEPEYSVS